MKITIFQALTLIFLIASFLAVGKETLQFAGFNFADFVLGFTGKEFTTTHPSGSYVLGVGCKVITLLVALAAIVISFIVVMQNIVVSNQK